MDNEFESLLDYLKQARGFDFAAYKRTTLTRRVDHRMQQVDIKSYADYVDFLEVHPDEFAQLFNTILINVTSFFRDESAWDYLAQEIIPGLLAAKGDESRVRAWVAGCASGEEVYTLAMVLRETLGEEAFARRAKIYATDLNEGDLNKARQAMYTAKDVAHVPEHLREKYFKLSGQYFMFDKDIRRAVVFGRHDLLQDSPISHIDLLLCRNTLMYFNAEAQAQVLRRFRFALEPGGYLMLGKAEMLLSNTDTFTPVDLKRRVFVKVGGHEDANRSDGLLNISEHASAPGDGGLLRSAALQTGAVAQLVVDQSGVLVAANERARELFGIESLDMGKDLRTLAVAARPVYLPTIVEQAVNNKRTISLSEIPWAGNDGDSRVFDVQVVPLLNGVEAPIGVSASFIDVTDFKRIRETLQQCNEERETTHEELQTTNEELQSTVEELETTNEELQSTNEELETMNEELQSTNEELRTTNEQLRAQSDELDSLNSFWKAVMGSVESAIAIIDQDYRVLVWNDRCEDMWGLRPGEVQGRNFLTLDIGLPVERLKQPIRATLNGDGWHEKLSLPATNRRGKAILCEISCTPLRREGIVKAGAILMMTETPHDGRA